MSHGFSTWTDFHPILVGAGCLALGYVYGRHCRSVSEIPAGVPVASDDVCCAQSQSNTYFEDLERSGCKCCNGAPAELDAKARKLTRSPYLVQTAAEGYEQVERSSKRDLAHRLEKSSNDGMRQYSCRSYADRGYQMLEEERFLQAKTPCKKQKGSVSSKGKGEMGFDPLSAGSHEEDEDAGAPWSREVLHKRISYFNNVSDTTAESGRSDESRKLRLIKKKFLKASAKEGEPAYNSTTTTTSHSDGVDARSGSTTGLVQLIAQQANHSPDSPHRLSGGATSDVPPMLLLPADTSKQGNELEATACQWLQSPSILPAPHYDRCQVRESSRDEVLQAEIYKLLSCETDRTKVSFEEIVSLLEERLQTKLQESKAHICDLVREVVGNIQLLEKEKVMAQVGTERNHDVRSNASTSTHLLSEFAYECPLVFSNDHYVHVEKLNEKHRGSMGSFERTGFS